MPSNEVLQNLVERANALRILVLVTARPEYQPAWCASPGRTVHELGPLNEAAIAAIITRVAKDGVLPQVLVARIIGRSDGVPLFAEELTKAALESGDVPEEDLAVPTAAVPATLRATLVARLDRVPVAKHLAGVGATIGRDFSYELLAAASGLGVDELESGTRFWFQVDADRDPPSSYPIAGPGLAYGIDSNGAACDVGISVAELQSRPPPAARWRARCPAQSTAPREA